MPTSPITSQATVASYKLKAHRQIQHTCMQSRKYKFPIATTLSHEEKQAQLML